MLLQEGSLEAKRKAVAASRGGGADDDARADEEVGNELIH